MVQIFRSITIWCYGRDITASFLRYAPAFPLAALKVILGLLRFLFLYLPRGKDEVAFVAK